MEEVTSQEMEGKGVCLWKWIPHEANDDEEDEEDEEKEEEEERLTMSRMENREWRIANRVNRH